MFHNKIKKFIKKKKIEFLKKIITMTFLDKFNKRTKLIIKNLIWLVLASLGVLVFILFLSIVFLISNEICKYF
jgi:lipopolysaccharide/colanic/teichoic acid biosynthesis glycosyltransferase